MKFGLTNLTVILFLCFLVPPAARAQTAPAPPADTGFAGTAQPQSNQRTPDRYSQRLNERDQNQPPLVRIKDISYIHGDRDNFVDGAGLVFGLSGTGGQAEQTRLMAQFYFERQGMPVTNAATKSMSAVFVSGNIPPYARQGEKIMVNVSVADDAKSLSGGTLGRTALRGIDGMIYAIANGPIIGSGESAGGAAASVNVNHPTAGRCEAIVEREISLDTMVNNGRIRLVLRNKDYSTATHIANALNSIFQNSARALDQGTVEVQVPRTFQNSLPAFISMIGDLRVRPDMNAKVVINQKTGTITMGQNVRISKAVFASANIVITTSESPQISQPAPFSQGVTAEVPRSNVGITDTGGNYNGWHDGITVGELANALNALAVSPNVMIRLFTSLQNQGALQAELVIE